MTGRKHYTADAVRVYLLFACFERHWTRKSAALVHCDSVFYFYLQCSSKSSVDGHLAGGHSVSSGLTAVATSVPAAVLGRQRQRRLLALLRA